MWSWVILPNKLTEKILCDYICCIDKIKWTEKCGGQLVRQSAYEALKINFKRIFSNPIYISSNMFNEYLIFHFYTNNDEIFYYFLSLNVTVPQKWPPHSSTDSQKVTKKCWNIQTNKQTNIVKYNRNP